MPPIIDDNKCIKCGICADICPVDVYSDTEENQLPKVSYGEECYFCGACVLECPGDAILLHYPLYAQPMYISDT